MWWDPDVDLFADAGVSLQPLEGGWSGETFVAEAGGERTVVRVFADGKHPPHAAEVYAALLTLVRGLLPVPRVLELRRAEPDTGTPGLLVTELLPGVRGDLLLPTLDDEGLQQVGEAFGRVAAALAGMPTLRAGLFADAELRIEPFGLELPAWVDAYAERLEGWSCESLSELRRVAEEAQDRLDAVARTCLVHGDLNPKNLLVDADTLEVTGVVDWEFAHSGTPFTDLGNLLRFDRQGAYMDGVLSGFQQLRGTAPEEARELARAADLVALVELAGRAGQNPVATRADERLRSIAGSGDLHAV